jgi:hypothetical protein
VSSKIHAVAVAVAVVVAINVAVVVAVAVAGQRKETASMNLGVLVSAWKWQ